MKGLFALAVLACLGLAFAELREGVCKFYADEGHPDYQVWGEFALIDESYMDTVFIHGFIDGLPIPANGQNKLFGIHIHEYGDITDACNKTGDHWNPTGLRHGGPTDAERHVGDLGNLRDLGNGVSYSIIYDAQISLQDDGNNVVGRSIVLDEYEDDLGIDRDTSELSATTGRNPGKRIACCTIAYGQVGNLLAYFAPRIPAPTGAETNDNFLESYRKRK